MRLQTILKNPFRNKTGELSPSYIASLIILQLGDNISPRQQKELKAYANICVENRALLDRLTNQDMLSESLKEYFLVQQEAKNPPTDPVFPEVEKSNIEKDGEKTET